MEVKNSEKFPKGNENEQKYMLKKRKKNESKCWWGFGEGGTFIFLVRMWTVAAYVNSAKSYR